MFVKNLNVSNYFKSLFSFGIEQHVIMAPAIDKQKIDCLCNQKCEQK